MEEKAEKAKKAHCEYDTRGRVASLLATGNTYIHNTLEEVVGYMMLHTFWRLGIGDFDSGEGLRRGKEVR